MKRRLNTILLALIVLSACEEIAFKPRPEASNVNVYEEFWKAFQQKYSMFEFKNVDWQQIYNNTRPQVNNSISEDSLFNVMGRMVKALRDGHSGLGAPGKKPAAFDFEKGFPKNLDTALLEKHYLNKNVKRLGGFTYTFLKDNIGFVTMRDFNQEVTDEAIDTILKEFADTKGLILDVRGNLGGDPFGASRTASHFTNKKVYVGYERFKTGIGAKDFTDSHFYLEPASGQQYTKPVMVLTNRQCYSATTTLLYSMDPLSHVVFIGGRTGGGSGSVADGQLINGWVYSLSVSEFIDAKGRHLDDGADPDILINLNESVKDKDEIIERAILEINKRVLN